MDKKSYPTLYNGCDYLSMIIIIIHDKYDYPNASERILKIMGE